MTSLFVFLGGLFAVLGAALIWLIRTPRCAHGHAKVKMLRAKAEELGEERYECPVCGRIVSRYFAYKLFSPYRD